MPYGKLKITTLTYDTGSGDVDVAVSGIPTATDINAKASLTGATFTGDVNLAATSDLRLQDTTGGEYVAFQAPGTVSTTYTLTMPADVGATGKVLKSTVSGQVATLTWETDSATDSSKMPLAGGTFTGNVNLGVNDTGVDCKFFGATAGAYLLWDESADSLLTGGGATIDIVKDKLKIGGTAVTTTAAELNLLDGKTAVGDAVLANDQTWTGAQRGTVTALTDASTIAVDFNSSNNFSVTLAGNRTLGQPSNQVVGQSGSIFITQDGTGSRTLAYHADWDFAGGTAPTISGAANAVDRIDYIVAAANKIHAVASLDVK